ncbi:uncharacterized protein LAJ45_10532 [Morchella importuna]|uniref:uncharacterized protein n=1 Tax=Morchella importuna TaxID=1174673 RepID=UPI001E8D6A0B|nr:uncharacterized protein LAJ45_10532 [Morchella importuna]KAH8145410.1 hypothetical protein LAJ45_10532 [Morchella importuna]
MERRDKHTLEELVFQPPLHSPPSPGSFFPIVKVTNPIILIIDLHPYSPFTNIQAKRAKIKNKNKIKNLHPSHTRDQQPVPMHNPNPANQGETVYHGNGKQDDDGGDAG